MKLFGFNIIKREFVPKNEFWFVDKGIKDGDYTVEIKIKYLKDGSYKILKTRVIK